MTTERIELLAAVMTARDQIAPEMDTIFLEEVMSAETDYPDNPEAATRAIHAALARALERMAAQAGADEPSVVATDAPQPG